MKRHAILLASALALSSAAAQTVTFESGADLTAFTTVVTGSGAVTQEAGIGAGAPFTGGLRGKGGSDSNDRGSVSYKAFGGTPSTFGTYQTSVLVNVREMNDTVDKGELRIGFTASNTTSTSKAWEFFHKQNPSISLVFKGEHKPSDSKNHSFEMEMSSLTVANGSESKNGKLPTVTTNYSTYFDHWLKINFTVTRTGAATFNASYTLDSLGADGTAAPTNILTSPVVSFTNAPLANAATVYHGFVFKTEKSKTSSMFLDDYNATATTSPPAAPIAAAATSVNSSGLTANWTPGSGLGATEYILELITQGSAFTSGQFINAAGLGGQSSGITIGSGSTLSQIITGLSPLVTYEYRVIAKNSAGDSAASNTVSATTPNNNAPPSIVAIANVGPIATYSPPITVNLTGIDAGGEPIQTVIITASSDNTAVIPHPTVSYTPPATTGTLTFDPTGIVGSATITVTANDSQAENNITTRTFTVTVQNPPVNVGYDAAGDLSHFNITSTNITNTVGATSGVGGGGGLISQIVSAGSDSSSLFLRSQTYPLPGVTQLTQSMMVNLREWDDIVSGERKGELRLGFSPTNTVSGSKPDEFFHKTNSGISLVLKGEHSPSDIGKFRKIECEIGSTENGTESKGDKLTLTNSSAMNNWLKLTLTLTPIGGNQFIGSYTLHDMGPDGTDAPTPLMTSAGFVFTNTVFGAAANLYAGYAVKMDKANTAALFVDDHTVTISTDAPSAPITTVADHITSTSFNASWVPGTGAYATGWIVEVVQGANAFTSGNFISESGVPGQSSGIPLNGNTLRTLRIGGLASSTQYRYQIKATNLNGSSAASGIISLTTLAVGQNAAPTLNTIPDPTPIAMNAGAQTVNLVGISDGGELEQTITVTAISSNETLIPHPTVTYFSPDATGTLDFTPNPGAVGSSTITVTVTDGGANNHTLIRTFTVQVVNPNPLIDFNLASDLTLINTTNAVGSALTHQTSAGTGTPATGAIRLEGTTPGVERVSVGVRPTAYDANNAGYLVTSMMVNFSQVLNTTTKDKGELRLGFMANSTPNLSNLKDTMHKTTGNASLGIVFKAEHEPAKEDKIAKLEVELFSGPSDTKVGKQTLLNQGTAFGHWMKVNLYAVRNGLSSFFLTYIIEDWGTDGTTYLGQVLSSGPHTFTSSAFGSDTSVFGTYVLNGDASGTSQLFADDYHADVNSTAPHAPIAQEEYGLSHTGFTASWSSSILGPEPDGYLIEVTTLADGFTSGTYYSATGIPGQTTGIEVADPYADAVSITGLTRQTTYLYRVRAYKGAEAGAVLNTILVTTPYGPGTEYNSWRTAIFGAQASDDAIAGPDADPDQDGVRNLLEWSLALNPQGSDAHLLPQADTSGPYLRLIYKRRHNVSGHSVTPEITSTLGSTDWHPEEVYHVSTSLPDATGMETVIVEDLFPRTAHPHRFIRLRIE